MLLEQVLELAGAGFHVFPVAPNGKTPVVKNWPELATRDPEKAAAFWIDRPPMEEGTCNIGIATGKFGDGKALCVVDIDNKPGKSGDASLLELELQGCEFPITLEQSTPSGGRHLIYVVDRPLKQGVNVLGEGLDIRSKGGYIVGPGSTINGRGYTITRRMRPMPAPAWLVDRLGAVADRPASDGKPLDGIDPDRAHARAIEYLSAAPVAVEGQGGDLTTFKVAAKLKDLGCTEALAADLMLTEWNHRCEPPWDVPALNDKVHHAYRYGKEAPGASAPEAVFHEAAAPAPEPDTGTHPFDKMNQEFAFIKKGAFVLQETTNEDGHPTTEHLNMAEFHGWFANVPFQTGKAKPRPISEWWLEWAQRRQYEAVVFSPQQDPGPRWYNLWSGFSVAPAATPEHPSVAMFREHALNNVCNGDETLCHWLLGFFAHMIQRPWEKPLVALVFRGRKGTGKNALVERVGQLLGQHFMVADDERYLLSNFNAHLESNLCFVLDEASWAGDKRAEGRLKGLITGAKHNIERKGKEGYKVKNLTRVVIIGNEKWLVPASVDERRFAVFTFSDGRRQDRKFFEDMRVGMEQGGYAHLLRFLLDYDLSGVDVNQAPATSGLIDQKHASLDPAEEWWFDCLRSNELYGSGFDGDIPPFIPKNRVHEAFKRWADTRNIRSRLPSRNAIYDTLAKVAPRMKAAKRRPDELGDATYSYTNPGIEVLRKDWEAYIGGSVAWDD